jgi:hypothetical protein
MLQDRGAGLCVSAEAPLTLGRRPHGTWEDSIGAAAPRPSGHELRARGRHQVKNGRGRRQSLT